jgi:DNA-binding LytR/AlgR family response regulator
MREYVKINRVSDTGIMTLMSMKQLEETLSKDRFMRIHRSYIINLDFLNKVERSRILFEDGTFIPVSEQYLNKVKEYIDKNSLK